MRKQIHCLVATVLATAIAATPVLAQQQRASSAGSRTIVVGRGGGSYLGVGVVEIDPERAKALNLKEERGVEIKSVADDSPAAKAGVKVGDVVLEYNGTAVQGTEQFQRLVRETPVGRQAKLVVWRGGSSQALSATLEARKGTVVHGHDGEFSFVMPEIPRPVIPDIPRFEMSWRSPLLGIDGESLNSQLAEFFGVKEGVLVRSVVKDSAAEKAGIKAGDVIVKVDASGVTSLREISSALRSLGAKKTFPVVVVRNKKEMTISVTLEEKGSGTRARGPVKRNPRVRLSSARLAWC